MTEKIAHDLQCYEVTSHHSDCRDKLHDIKGIVPDDQRLIGDLHTNFRMLVGRNNNPPDLVQVEEWFNQLTVILNEYKNHTYETPTKQSSTEIIDAYLSSCHDLVYYAVQLYC